jgi:hypothetical protein
MGFILMLLGALLAIGAVIAIFTYFIAIVALWILGITAVGLSLLFISLTGNSYLGVGLGVIATLIIFGVYGHYSDKNP